MMASLTVALAGNPNVGKSTIFNALTGSHQRVGNWPGKTIEKKEGRLECAGRDIILVDLPGIYSLTAHSIEEIIARDYILDEHPDLVVTVVDASNLERNLYLVTQVIELERPVVIVLNMTDMAQKRGVSINLANLSRELGGVPIVEMVGTRGIGVDDLKHAIVQVEQRGVKPVQYDDVLEQELGSLCRLIASQVQGYPARWLAIKLLEDDAEVIQSLEAQGHANIVQAAREASARILDATGEDPDTLLVERRYIFINEAVQRAVRRADVPKCISSDQIDRIVTHRILGLPIFLLLMWVVFQFAANVSAPFLDWIDGVISGPVSYRAAWLLNVLGLQGTWVEGLVLDGVIAGVGGVLVFVPVLIFLYLAIAILEDSGYMARAAFVMDRIMRLVGLHGKSFLPLLVGFGCNVPAVYATRILDNENDRKVTAFLTAFMSCGARLPVYVLFGAAFFGAQAGMLVFGMYVLGIVIALITGFLLKRTVFKEREYQPFVLELPPYRMPAPQAVARQVWTRTVSFVRKAATIILTVSIVIWFLMAMPVRGGTFGAVSPEDSAFGSVSAVFAPVFEPAGFGDWQAAGSLVTGFVAKEVVVSAMSQIYGVSGSEAEDGYAAVSILDDANYLITSFGEASILTVQETLNIVPRTANVVPGVSMHEANFLRGAEAETSDGALENILSGTFTPLGALAFSAFVLLYAPCMATVAAMRQEFGNRLALFQIGYMIIVAWLVAVAIFQIGTLLGLGGA